MGACLITEGLALMNYFERIGLGPFVLTGFSMGGYMASLTATVSTKPVALVPCLSWTTAGPVFTRGYLV
jgi:predicted alpha/beta-hydrolase family hydrolase